MVTARTTRRRAAGPRDLSGGEAQIPAPFLVSCRRVPMVSRPSLHRIFSGVTLAVAAVLFAPRSPLFAQALPSIAEKTRNLQKLDGFFPLYWDPAAGKLWLEIPRLGEEFLYITG